jgi:hypothetical protein
MKNQAILRIQGMEIEIDKLIAYENGELDDIATIILFQELVDSGIVWHLNNHYAKKAMNLIDEGKIRRKEE